MPKFILHPSFAAVMRKLIEALKPWRWCLIGGRAVEVWANPPQTPDVDVLAAVEDQDIDSLQERFRSRGIHVNESVEGLGSPMLFFEDTKLRVEVDLIGAYEPIHFAIIERAPMKTVQGVRFPTAYAEDIVILKSQAAIDPGRPPEKRIRDRRAIFDIAKSVKLNREHIEDELSKNGWTEELSLLRLMRVV